MGNNNNKNMMTTKDNGGISVGFGGANLGFGWADNSLTCDSEGNCMLKDELRQMSQAFKNNMQRINAKVTDDLGSASGKIGRFSGGIKWADNSLSCDSEGSCMLKDSLSKSS